MNKSLSRLVAIGALVVALAASGVLGGAIAASTGRHRLGYADRAEESDPPQVAVGIAMGAFRGLFVNWLWMRANDLKEEGRLNESNDLARAITRLQPRFPRVWAFHAWNLSYNISVTTQTPQERWQWVEKGINLLRREGVRANPNDLLIHKELAWIFLHKVAGYTDDANQYYKRVMAEEWTIVVGVPPRPPVENRTREAVSDLYCSAMLRPIDEAADTVSAAIAREPSVAGLVEAMRAAGLRPDGAESDVYEALRRYTLHTQLRLSPYRAEIERSFGEDNKAFAALLDDPANKAAWDTLIPTLRKRLLSDRYNMSAALMIRYTQKYGPIDWRHPAGHALYWAARGVERSLGRVTEENKQDFDFLNTDRVVVQSIQELWRSGELYFNFIDFAARNLRGYYQASPNPHFVWAYGEVAEEVARRGGVFESDARPLTAYRAGYENFLRDVVTFFFRRGEMERAAQWHQKFITLPEQTVHDPVARLLLASKTLEEFVQENLKDRFTSPHVAVNQFYAALDDSFAALIVGDEELYRAQFDFAINVHRFFLSNQLRDVVAAGGDAGRMEFLDRDFFYLAGTRFANFMGQLPLSEAELLYFYAPVDLRRYAYDPLVAALKETYDKNAKETPGARPFAEVFPEPPGMEAFRVAITQKERERTESGVEGLRQK